MKFIKPNSVSGEILNLLDEATEKMVIVSPYCKFDKWYRLVNKIKDLKTRNITTEFYVREGEYDTIQQVKNIGIDPICIPNLHCKLYFNEKSAIVTSMNLLLSSEINSLELGYKTENSKEYKELITFYSTYLNKLNINNVVSKDKIYSSTDWIDNLDNCLTEKFGYCKIYYDKDNTFTIRTKSNTYTSFIWSKNNINTLRMNAILSGDEFEYATNNVEFLAFDDFKIDLDEGKKGYYNTAWASSVRSLNSINIEEIIEADVESIVMLITAFIEIIEDLKNKSYAKKKLSNNILK